MAVVAVGCGLSGLRYREAIRITKGVSLATLGIVFLIVGLVATIPTLLIIETTPLVVGLSPELLAR